MKLKHFVARGVHGYLNFDLAFHDHLTFLVGPNGSGKSTALALMESVLTPALRELALLDFAVAELSFDDGAAKKISVVKSDSDLVINADWVGESLRISNLDRKRREILLNDKVAADEFFSNLTLEQSSSPVLKAISDVAPPVFLGIERQHKRDVRQGDLPHHVHADLRSGHAIRSGVAARRLLRGNLAAGLVDTQIIVQEAYRTARRLVDASQERLRTDVLLSAFKYTDIEADVSSASIYSRLSKEDVTRLERSRHEISDALAELGVDRELVDERVGTFFRKLSDLTKRMEKLDKAGAENTILEFFTNRGHVQRLQDLIALVQDFKKKTDKSFHRIHQFSAFMNSFYKDSGKEVAVDQIGRIVITRRDGRSVALDALSSGERQLIIIFSHIFFNLFGARSRVFVIDEPELSLHMRWQESLVESIRRASPDAQLIFATHSPDIVGEFKNRCVQV